MREIKFRGKRIDSGEWVEGFLFVSQMSGCFILLSKINIKKHRGSGITMGDKLEQYEVDPTTVGQYTELKDKNDTEIWEGDIVKINNIELPTAVTYERAGFYTITAGGYYRLGGWVTHTIKVIGNIHDNPKSEDN